MASQPKRNRLPGRKNAPDSASAPPSGTEQFKSLAENSPDIIDRFDRRYRHLYVNRAGARLHGVPAARVRGKTIREPGVPAPYRNLWEQRIRKVFALGKPMNVSDTFPTPQGLRYFESRCVPEFDSRGQVQTVLVVSRDIMDRRNVEQMLRASEMRISSILASIQEDFYVLSREWIFVYASTQFTSRIGKKPKDFIGRNIWEMFPRHLGTVYEKNLRAAMRKREIRRFELHGQYTDAWYEMGVFPCAEGIACLGTDITERKRIELELQRHRNHLEALVKERTAALQESEERLKLAQRAAHLGTFDWDIARRRVLWSPATERIWGLRKGEFRGTYEHWRQLIHPDDVPKAEALARKALADPKVPYAFEHRIVCPDGMVRWVFAKGITVRNALGKPIRMVGLNMDITERKRMEEQLKASNEVLEAKVRERTVHLRALASELTQTEHRERRRIADILHEDLQQRLAAMQLRIHQLKERHTDASTIRDAEWLLEELQHSVDLSRDLTTQLRPPVLYELGLRSAFEWLAGDVKERFDLCVNITGVKEFQLPSDAMTVFVYEAVRELLMNVVKHSGVKIATVRIAWRGKDKIAIEVSDKGKGFSETPQTRASRGFGLFSIRERIEAFGGRFGVRSQLGTGTSATLILPAR